ncbi:MAG: hypothetical protein M1828_001884 [Chrysothrix sp. TS-e1954]|nr:MAG: hypothetical protein M1828_001884 [Chrysothrix sp. TS-e1954]
MAHKGLSGHLLCAIPFPQPTQVIDNIKSRYPNLKVTFIQTKLPQTGSDAQTVSSDVWKDVTLLSTLYDLPPSLEQAPLLVSAGSDHIEESELYTKSNILITTSSGIHGPIIGEWVIMTLLAASHKYPVLHEWQKAPDWNDTPSGKANFAPVADNVGKRFGILGYGSIGRQVARCTKALGMDVLAFTMNPRDTAESRRDYGYVVPGTGDPKGEIPSAWFSGSDKKSLHHFLDQDLDYLLISLPLTKQTKHLLQREEFRILSKKNAYLIDIARGDIVAQDDLVEALYEFEKSSSASHGSGNGLRGAAIDVATPEPLPKSHRLWDAHNCIITPHMSGINKSYSNRALHVLNINPDRLAKGDRMLNVVDRQIGYASKRI